MLTHSKVWGALDRLATLHGLTASGLARKAGLDSTAFNPSKRIVANGHERWPSTESIAKVLSATQTSVDDFFALLGEAEPSRAQGGFDEPGDGSGRVRILPQISLEDAQKDDSFDPGGRPSRVGWDAIGFPNVHDPAAYALEVSGDRFRPVYRDGDMLIVSPAADIRRGDRVVAKRRQGDLMVAELVRRTARTVELATFDPAAPPLKLRLAEVRWMARIVWVSQ